MNPSSNNSSNSSSTSSLNDDAFPPQSFTSDSISPLISSYPMEEESIDLSHTDWSKVSIIKVCLLKLYFNLVIH
jgi:hypothetical protein